jgi:hypothetical protein
MPKTETFTLTIPRETAERIERLRKLAGKNTIAETIKAALEYYSRQLILESATEEE